jgi:retinol dehydrogenase 12
MNVAGKSILITGSNTGIGRVTAEQLAKDGAHVILACRSADKTTPVVDGIRGAGGSAELLELDLASLASVRSAAETFLATGKPLHQLINNAGLAASGLTKDGFELTFGVNHIGHYLLTRLLLPRLVESDAPRIVNVSSKAHYRARTIDFDTIRKTSSLTALPEYSVSKLANVLFAKELARRYPQVISTSLHPGVVASDAWRRLPWGLRHVAKAFMITTEDGAKTTVHCATSDEVRSGAYYDRSREKKPSAVADDEALARTLWDKSAEWVGLAP